MRIVKPIKYEQCSVFKIKINNLYNTLDKFIKAIDNLNLIIDSQRAYSNKIGVDYEPKNNTKFFSNICYAN